MTPIPDLRELLRYEPETGHLFWLPRPLRFFSAANGISDAISKQARFNTIFAGQRALTAVFEGRYYRGRVLYRNTFAHRAAAALYLGYWPVEVDHWDHDGLNNTWANLRPCDRMKNAANRRKQKGCTSQYLGVSWCKEVNAWVAQAKLGGKSTNLGSFKSEEAAARAYDRAVVAARGEFANPNFPVEH